MFESFEHYWKSRKPDLDEALRKQIHRLLLHVPTSKSEELHIALDGGKKLQGVLLGMITEELGGEWELALPRAVAVELSDVEPKSQGSAMSFEINRFPLLLCQS